MKADIVTLVIFVFCLGVLISALDIGQWFDSGAGDQNADPVVLQQSKSGQ